MSLKQVDSAHYRFGAYMSRERWASMWHQLDEAIALAPTSVLEVGPGPGVFSTLGRNSGLDIVTLDLDPELSPDCVGSMTRMPFADGSFDLVCAFQVLEHVPFAESIVALSEMARVARRSILVSLPDARRGWPISAKLPWIGKLEFLVTLPFLPARLHTFDGQHHWEVNKKGYGLRRVAQALATAAGARRTRTFRVHENSYHRFFVFDIA
jgi:SAM-dependent methyltransferase